MAMTGPRVGSPPAEGQRNHREPLSPLPPRHLHAPPPPAANSPPPEGDTQAAGEACCNISALCEHIQAEGFGLGAFSDIVVKAMGSSYHLHRLILSRSSYFRNMLHGPWREAAAPALVLQFDDANVNSEAVTMALAYLYGHRPKLTNENAFRVLAAASFLDLQDLCAICTDFIISELWTSNFLEYQIFAESQDYGVHGERVRNACWGYLCQSATMDLREVLPKLSSQTLHALLTSDELWVANEEKRFELALYAFRAKSAMSEADHTDQESVSSEVAGLIGSSIRKGRILVDDNPNKQVLESEVQCTNINDNLGHQAYCAVDFNTDVSCLPSIQLQQSTCSQQLPNSEHSYRMKQPAHLNPLDESHLSGEACTYTDVENSVEEMGLNIASIEGPSDLGNSHYIHGNVCLPRNHLEDPSEGSSSANDVVPNGWGKLNMPLWGGRIVGRRQVKNPNGYSAVHDGEYDAFINIFEGGSLLYCNMPFEPLLNARKQLEELGFPCKAVNDGLWLQMLLCHRVHTIVADTCTNCCLRSNACPCRQSYGYSHGGTTVGSHRQEHERNTNRGYLADNQGEGSGRYGSVRVDVRGQVDGLAGIGRGTAFASSVAWPTTRYVFSRVPFGLGNRNGQQSLANDESDSRLDVTNDLSGDGLTALVNLSQRNNALRLVCEQTERTYESESQNRCPGVACIPMNGVPVPFFEPQKDPLGSEWESTEGSSISLDMETPLHQFPPFRFGVEFEDAHMLHDGQVKHSPEVFYAGSLWKVSVQAFSDEDPQGRRTLGLFLHRRKADSIDSLRKAHMYVVDCRDKVTARYQLICPSKKEIMVFGSIKQAGTLLPKAPKGWGWRTALLFDELNDLLQGGMLRVAAVVQLV